MRYKLTFFDKFYLFTHTEKTDRYYYLIPKLEKFYNNYFESIGIRKPYNYEQFILNKVSNVIFEYENRI